MKQLLTIACICIFSFSYAQNKDIVKVGETFVDYPVGSFDFKQLMELDIQGHFKSKNLKIYTGEGVSTHFSSEKNNLLAHYICSNEYLNSSQVELYKDAALSQSLDKASLEKLLDRPGKELNKKGAILIRLASIQHMNFKALRVKGAVFYNNETHHYTFEPIAFAPLAINYIDANKKEDGEKVLQKTPFHQAKSNKLIPVFWIKPNYDIQQDYRYQDKNIIIIKRMIRAIKFNEMQGFSETMEDFVQHVKKNQKELDLYSLKPLNTYYSTSKMTDEEKKRIFTTTLRDTIITFDPVDFVEIPYYMATTFDAEHIESLQFVHQWAWDDKNKRLYIKQTGIMPELTRPLEEGSAAQKVLDRWPEFLMETP